MKHFIVPGPFKLKSDLSNCWKWLCRTPSASCFSLAEEEDVMFSVHFNLHLISVQFLTPCYGCSSYLLYLVCLVSPGEILHLSAIPKSEWDWIWKCRVLQTSSFCWCCGTWQRGEQDIFLGETNTRAKRHLCASRHMKPDTHHTYSSVNGVHYRKKATTVKTYI